ncbi:MAG: serine--tRNA ligase [Bacteroidia bacterium]|nr:MAG: serine--tRNA ligase [Bacteroidia bacterium]
MLQLQLIIENKERTIRGLKKKHFPNAEEIVEKLIKLDEERRSLIKQSNEIKNQINILSKEIGELFKSGKKEEAEQKKQSSIQYKSRENEIDEQLKKVETELHNTLVLLPNLPHDSVPEGKSAEENLVVYQFGEISALSENALCHWDLAQKYDIIDFETGVKLTGSGFPVYKGKGAKLQRALINFFLDKATQNGYVEIEPPILVNEASGFGTGQLPDKDGQMYYVNEDKLYLIPTAEVPITNIYRDVILKEEDLPIKNCGYTPCFRREAGSYGKDVRGLNRLHQFDKVEIVQIAHPEKSYEVLEEMREYVAGLLRELEIPFRTVKLCGGDMSFASALTYDMEVYSAAQKRWLEVSSISNFETFQTNRLKCRFKDKNGKTQLAHSLNGSALALPRIVAAILENNQSEKGIRIPKVLVPYTGFEWIN